VRRTGGLADTVVDATEKAAIGFAFDDETDAALLEAAARAVALYRDRARWRRMVRRAMTRDFSWGAAAREYLALYQGLIT